LAAVNLRRAIHGVIDLPHKLGVARTGLRQFHSVRMAQAMEAEPEADLA
jgi:hypothetical protein